MRTGLFFDLRNPPAWRQDPARLHAFTLEVIEEAEHLGIDSIWLSEHHLFSDDYLAAPLAFLAAAAARTSRVRLGADDHNADARNADARNADDPSAPSRGADHRSGVS